MPARVSFVLQKLFLQLALGGFLASSLVVSLNAQDASPTPATAKRARPAASSTPPPFEYVPVKKAGFLEKLFKKKPTPTPQATPASSVAPATPKPTPRKKRKASIADPDKSPTPAASPTSTPGDSEIQTIEPTPQTNIEPEATPAVVEPTIETPTAPPVGTNVGDRLPDSLPPLSTTESIALQPTPTAKPQPTPTAKSRTSTPQPTTAPVVTTSTPPSQAVRNNPLNQPIPLLSESAGAETVSVPSPEALREKETTDRILFRKVKARALEDASLQKLQEATETAETMEDRYAALKKYYPKLFATMRKLDGTLSVQIDEMEAAARRRLERMASEAAENSSSR